MPSFDESHTQQNPRHLDAGGAEGGQVLDLEALADLQERLAQLGHIIGEARNGLPEVQAEALGRIEQGIARLSDRMAAFGHDRRRQGSAAARPVATAEAGEPWDVESAEALMRAYETAEAEAASGGPTPSRRPAWQARDDAEPKSPLGSGAVDQAWLEQRFAAIAAVLERSRTEVDPARALAALDRRLDQFERRLETALSDMALRSGGDGMSVINAHVKELSAHFDATCRQLARLESMDGQLRDLARTLQDRNLQPPTGPASLSDDDISALIDTAAERAVSRLATSLPAAGGAPDGESHRRIDALEGVLQDYITERRRGEEVTGGILQTIEDALTRIVGRMDALGATGAAPPARADDDVSDRDGLEIESDRLAEAYAAGARALGHERDEPTLDAADYSPSPSQSLLDRSRRADSASAAPIALLEDETRRELRASALRAKIKAQATTELPASATPPAKSGLDEAKTSMLEDRRPGLAARASSHRFSLLLGAAMALLCGTGFLIVDALLGSSAPQGSVPRKAAANPPAAVKIEARPAVVLARPGSTPAKPELRPAADKTTATPIPAATPGLAAPSEAPAAAPVPPTQPQPQQVVPEAVTDDARQDAPAPTRRLDRLRAGGPDVAPVVISAPAETGSLPSPSAEGAAELALPPTLGTPQLRSAALNGDRLAQFEVGGIYAEGNGVAQDYNQAFAWYERAATRGLPSAQFRMGVYLERGVGVAVDHERARVWYLRAAQQGYVRAMHNLAVLSVSGRAAQPDYATAAIWFRNAAERGLTDSQFNLGVLCENGRGVTKDLVEAYKWFALAARDGDLAAARRLDQLKARLDPAALEVAERKLAAWRPIPTRGDSATTAAAVR
jgi:localization factor PodJL